MEAGNFVVGRRLGDRLKAAPIEDARGELAWLEYQEEAWQAQAPRTLRRPPGSELYYQGQPVPRSWSKALALDTDRTSRYFFYVWACELTPDDSPEEQSPVTWQLEGWLPGCQPWTSNSAPGNSGFDVSS